LLHQIELITCLAPCQLRESPEAVEGVTPKLDRFTYGLFIYYFVYHGKRRRHGTVIPSLLARFTPAKLEKLS
jgi:hypothetical protein